jgi:hypothetical protein
MNKTHDGTLRIHFGKHKGKTIEEIPSGYLKWIEGNIENNDELVEAAHDEYEFRTKWKTHFEE